MAVSQDESLTSRAGRTREAAYQLAVDGTDQPEWLICLAIKRHIIDIHRGAEGETWCPHGDPLIEFCGELLLLRLAIFSEIELKTNIFWYQIPARNVSQHVLTNCFEKIFEAVI